MLKFSCALSLLLGVGLGTCAAQSTHPVVELQSTARVLIVFSPDSNSANYKRQLQLLEHHAYELAERNTVLVPIPVNTHANDDQFTGENLSLSSVLEQEYERSLYHVQPTQFLVLLLNQDGTVSIRSESPVDIHALTASLGAPPKH